MSYGEYYILSVFYIYDTPNMIEARLYARDGTIIIHVLYKYTNTRPVNKFNTVVTFDIWTFEIVRTDGIN